ncbi:hypothetical protein KGF54_003036 [Candida jiufengensis]|uniref:uncharacterized protein n=1 Tax=Candida jiufengensis TaxID=497108 RepID=UPI00222415DF|nr:uncharacterized protein KGF54_003036 [Candida jiufengensis]KAI5953664.1 hypothetical protein KGF54_003036 [Candida jiufengensis]
MPSISDLDHENPVGLSSKQIQSIAIIGGGASAAIILDTLLKEPDSNIRKIVIYERQDKLGGVWYLNPQTIKTPNHIIKSGNINFENDPQLANPFHDAEELTNEIRLPRNNQERFLQTPSYHGIKTNIIENMMTYSDNRNWGVEGNDRDGKYVVGTVVQKYIESYVNQNLNNSKVKLSLNSTVEDVERIDRSDDVELQYRFKLTVREELKDSTQDRWYQEEFDSVIVATGHYHVPFIPHVPGLKNLQEKYPDLVQHAKFYRSSEPYKGKTAIVVGSRASGSDLTKFIAREPGTKVYQSIRNYERTKVLSSKTNVESKPPIASIELLNSESNKQKIKVLFEDGSIVYDPDHIIYCTGYLFSYPYLNRLFNNSITHEGMTVSNLYQHTFLVNEPLITIIGVPIDGISFRVFEYQAILLSRYITGKIRLPSRNEQIQWVNNRYDEKSNTRLYHTIGVVDALPYAQTLVRLGQVSSKTKVGREFPIMTEAEVQEYKEAGEKLRKFWDER